MSFQKEFEIFFFHKHVAQTVRLCDRTFYDILKMIDHIDFKCVRIIFHEQAKQPVKHHHLCIVP